jgi:hypothetical protein
MNYEVALKVRKDKHLDEAILFLVENGYDAYLNYDDKYPILCFTASDKYPILCFTASEDTVREIEYEQKKARTKDA